MTKPVPSLLTMMHELISEISVSSTSAQWDTGNRRVIDKLAEWLTTLGFSCEVLPLAGSERKANLIATLGSGPGGLVLSVEGDSLSGRWGRLFEPIVRLQRPRQCELLDKGEPAISTAAYWQEPTEEMSQKHDLIPPL